MRRTLFFLLMIVFLLSPKVYGYTIHEDGHYFCGFDSEDEFLTWTKVDVNGPAQNGNSDWWWDRNELSAYICPSFDFGCDDWLFSPSVRLENGKVYAVKLKARMSSTVKLSITLGSAATIESQNVVIQETLAYQKGDYYMKFSIPEDLESGEYNFGIHVTSDAWTGFLHIQSFEVVEDNDGSLKISTINEKNGTPVANVQVSLVSQTFERMSLITDDQGKVEFTNLTPGVYSISGNIEEYYPFEGTNIVVDKNSEVDYSMALEEKHTTLVSGTLTGEDGIPLKGIKVQMNGVLNYEAVSDEYGAFVFPKVRQEDTPYMLIVECDYRKTFVEDILAMDVETVDLGEITLKTFVSEPVNVNTSMSGQAAVLSWMLPVREKDFIWDTNVYNGENMYAGYSYVTVGNRFEEPMVVTNISWLFVDAAPFVDLYIFGLNSDGSINYQPLYEEKNVANPNLYSYSEIPIWNEYTLSKKIIAPYGCIVAVGCKGDKISICSDYSQTYHSVCRVGNEDFFQEPGTFFVRAKGETFDFLNNISTKLVPYRCKMKKNEVVSDSSFASFKIWRFKVSDKEDKSKWVLLGNQNPETFLFDDKFLQNEPGFYQYAIQTVYADGHSSDYTFSGIVENKMRTSCAVSVLTNTAIDFSDGALVSLKNLENDGLEYVQTAVGGESVQFSEIVKGEYRLTVMKEGFTVYTGEYTIENNDKIRVTLELIKQAPFNLQTEQIEKTNDVLLKWNVEDGIFDDFEAMEDFALNPVGEHNWIYLDADGKKTYGVAMCQQTPYPNMYEPMAFMAFNPSETQPNLLSFVQPHSGNKLLIDVSLEDGSQNDDYLFSPELSFEDDFIMSFYAASGFFAAPGKEKFMVGYTLDSPSPENVVWITECPVEVGAIWTHFSYSLPKEARHAVIRCVSNQTLFFMLDDLFIGYKESSVFSMCTFEVFVDEELVGKTNQRSLRLNGLDEGKHIAKIQTVYVMADNTVQYSDLSEIIFEVKNEGSSLICEQKDSWFNYDAKNRIMTIDGAVENLSVVDLQGRVCLASHGHKTLSLQHLEKGIYLIYINVGGKIISQKIIVK